MRISQKQNELVQAVASRKYNRIFLIGALGTSKTYIMAYVLISIAFNYPDSYIPVGRKTLAEIRVGTLHSFIEVLKDMGLDDGKQYRMIGGFGGNDILFRFANGSIIQFLQLDYTKDPQWQKIKSINATAAGVDEVDGVHHEGYTMLSARVGRKNNNGQPEVIIATCNPNETWVKENVYTPYRKGTLDADVKVIEFDTKDSFLGENFYHKYESNPQEWKLRYLKNDWDYLDDEHSLFKSRVLDNIHTTYTPVDETVYIGVDVAREGKDRSVMARIEGDVLMDIRIRNKQDLDRLALPEEKQAPPYTHILGREVIKYADKYSAGYARCAGDAVGNGAGLIDYCRSQGFNIVEFKAGSRSLPRKATPEEISRGIKPIPDYDMIRSEVYHKLSQAMENDEFFFHDSCPFLSDLKQELLFHQYEIRDKQMYVEKKDEIKKRLGKSPDIADAVMIAFWIKTHQKIGTYGSHSPVEGEDETIKEVEVATAGLLNRRF